MRRRSVSKELDQLAVNTIRTLALDAIQAANSGHPGLPLGAAPMAYALWMRHLRHNPANPSWANRDRFVLSAGHGSMLLYALLHLTGYALPLDELRRFRQWGSMTPGHPEYGHTPGVETTTGPLGQGIATAVGMALAEAFLAAHFNRPGHTIVDHHTYVLASDGDLMEGIAIEACSLAGHWGLGKLVVLYDDNAITLDGEARMTFTDDVPARFTAQGWHVLTVADGNDIDAIDTAIAAARAVSDQPSLISVKTIIGYGSPNKAGTHHAHGSPLGAEETRLTKDALGWPKAEPFHIPAEALMHYRNTLTLGEAAEGAWNDAFAAWADAFPESAAEWEAAFADALPTGWDADLPVFDDSKPMATRNASGKVLNAIARHFPTMIGGDGDLAGSTKTLIKGAENTAAGQPAARNIRFGVREHAMGAIVNGLALHGGVTRPYSATFLTFSDYMRPAIRLGALMGVPAIYVFTHDSIGLGEDGPTHQPVEQTMSLRLIPGLHVYRPADANETAGAWRAAMLRQGPSALIFSRQDLPVLADNPAGLHEGVALGAYVLVESEAEAPEVILLATGSEVAIALEAFEQLDHIGVAARVVSMPCWEAFEEQPASYRDAVLPPAITARVSIEAGVSTGWERYVGDQGIIIGVDRFGASAPYQQIYDAYGLTAQAVVEAVRALLDTEE
jgi:transketolase